MLHLIFESTLDQAIFERVALGDVFLLLDDAVFRTLATGDRAVTLSEVLTRARCLVLEDHLTIRGLNSAELVPGIEMIGYEDFVGLTLEHAVIQSWRS